MIPGRAGQTSVNLNGKHMELDKSPTHHLERQQWFPIPRDLVFDFFGRAENLERITPPWMGFKILTPPPIEMKRGTRIDYRIRLGPIPLRWKTAITVWQRPEVFVDLQERGPYRFWKHTHTFTEIGGGTLVSDHVAYELPGGAFGRAAHAIAVRSTLAAIFDFRFRRMRELLMSPDGARPMGPVGVDALAAANGRLVSRAG